MFKILWLIFVCSITMKPLSFQARPSQSDYCMGHKLDEFVANPNNCKLFYWCGENEEAVMAACPGKMLFNPHTKLCDNAERVRCKLITNTTTSPEIITTDIPAQTDQYCKNVYAIQRNLYNLVFLQHPHNCQQYYMCYHGQALLLSCSPKLHWNSKSGKCDLPFNAECYRPVLEDEEDEEEENVEVLPSSLEETIWGNGIKCPSYGEHIFPNTKHCASFIYCVKGQAVMQSCPFYHFFDVESARCKWRSKATCVKDLNLKYRKRTF